MVQSIFGSLTIGTLVVEQQRESKWKGMESQICKKVFTNCWHWRVRERERDKGVSKKSSYSTQSKHQRCFMPFHSPNLIYIVLLCEHTHTYTLDNFRSKSVGMHVFERARQRIFIILIETWCKWFQAPPCVSTVDTSVCAFSLHFCSVLPWIFILWPPFYMLHDSRACVWILSHFISTDVANRKCTQAGAPMFASQKKPHHAHAKMRNRKSIFSILFYFMTDLAWYKQVSHTTQLSVQQPTMSCAPLPLHFI